MEYFSAGKLIQTQLIANLASPDVPCAVQFAAGWKQVVEQLQKSPACFIWHQADKILSGDKSNRNHGKNQIVDQIWTVVVTVRNVADISGTAAQADADLIIKAVLKLQGIKLDADHGHLYRVQSQYMTGYTNGYGLTPFAFSTRIFT